MSSPPRAGQPPLLPAMWDALRPRVRREGAVHAEVGAVGVRLEPGLLDTYVSAAGGLEPPAVPLVFPLVATTPLQWRLLADLGLQRWPGWLRWSAVRLRRHRTLAIGTSVDVVARGTLDDDGVRLELTLTQDGAVCWEGEAALGWEAPRGAAHRHALGPVRELAVPAGIGRSWALVSGASAPWSWSRWVGRAVGYPGAVAPWPWVLARCLAELGDTLGPGDLDVVLGPFVTAPGRMRVVAEPLDDGRLRFTVWADDPVRPSVSGVFSAG